MIVEKRQPALCGFRIPRCPFHPPGDRSLGNFKSEHKQLVVNARRSPAWVVSDHPVDEIANFLEPVFFQSVQWLWKPTSNTGETRFCANGQLFPGDQDERLLPTGP